MRSKLSTPSRIRVAMLGTDPLRFIGFRALLEKEQDIELTSVDSEDELRTQQSIQIVVAGGMSEHRLLALTSTLKAANPKLHIIVTGTNLNDETVTKIIASGARGYVNESFAGAQLARAIRLVKEDGVWAPRHVLAQLIEQSRHLLVPHQLARHDITVRETQVLQMLVGGRSNKEIAGPLGIEERTVKAHVAKLMRKAGVQNRIALTVHALSHELVPAEVS